MPPVTIPFLALGINPPLVVGYSNMFCVKTALAFNGPLVPHFSFGNYPSAADHVVAPRNCF